MNVVCRLSSVLAAEDAAPAGSDAMLADADFSITASFSLSLAVLMGLRSTHPDLVRLCCDNLLTVLRKSTLSSAPTVRTQVALIKHFLLELLRSSVECAFALVLMLSLVAALRV